MSNKDKVTLGDISALKAEIGKLKTISEWKACVKRFAVKHGLTDMEAIDIANGRHQ
jgi:hypothetical protein